MPGSRWSGTSGCPLDVSGPVRERPFPPPKTSSHPSCSWPRGPTYAAPEMVVLATYPWPGAVLRPTSDSTPGPSCWTGRFRLEYSPGLGRRGGTGDDGDVDDSGLDVARQASEGPPSRVLLLDPVQDDTTSAKDRSTRVSGLRWTRCTGTTRRWCGGASPLSKRAAAVRPRACALETYGGE